MKLFSIIKFIAFHPLNRGKRLSAVLKFIRYQFATRLFESKFLVNWVNDTKFLVSKGETGITGNLYCGLMEYEDMSNEERIEYLLSEIVFKKKNEEINLLIKKIQTSINEIGFNNTANIYSISESSKFGGKIGWVSESNLSQSIFDSLKKINEGQLTDVLQIGNSFIILKIEKKRSKKVTINKNEELNKMIKFETNKQLNQFSQIYFNKAKLNYSINEK